MNLTVAFEMPASTSLTSFVSFCTCTSICVPTYMYYVCIGVNGQAADFERLLGSMLRAHRYVRQTRLSVEEHIALAASTSITHTQNVTTQIFELQMFDAILALNQQFLNRTQQSYAFVVTSVTSSSVSASPYTTNTDLAAVLRDGQTNTALMVRNMGQSATRAHTRYAEIVRDVNRQVERVLTAPASLLTARIVEARDELIEGVPDATARLNELLVAATEADNDIQLRLANIKQVLVDMEAATAASAVAIQPAFSTYLRGFIQFSIPPYEASGKILVVPTPTLYVPTTEPSPTVVTTAEPSTPAAQPSTPAAEPSTPAAQPSTPAAQPSTPAAEPSTPATQQSTPAAQPSTPAAQSSTPAGTSSAPSAVTTATLPQTTARPVGGKH